MQTMIVILSQISTYVYFQSILLAWITRGAPGKNNMGKAWYFYCVVTIRISSDKRSKLFCFFFRFLKKIFNKINRNHFNSTLELPGIIQDLIASG